MTNKTHEDRIRYLCYLITALFPSKQLTVKEKYELIGKHAIAIQNEAEDKIARE
jgi:hypothetical protein